MNLEGTENKSVAKTSEKEVIQWALSQKGKGSVSRVWNAAKKARSEGNETLSAKLADIARGKAAYAKKKKSETEGTGFDFIDTTVNTILSIFR